MSRNFEEYGVADTFEFMSNNGSMPAAYVRQLQDEHNVNLHADNDGDEYLDASDDDDSHDELEVIDEDEFIERFTESGAAEKMLLNLGYQL